MVTHFQDPIEAIRTFLEGKYAETVVTAAMQSVEFRKLIAAQGLFDLDATKCTDFLTHGNLSVKEYKLCRKLATTEWDAKSGEYKQLSTVSQWAPYHQVAERYHAIDVGQVSFLCHMNAALIYFDLRWHFVIRLLYHPMGAVQA